MARIRGRRHARGAVGGGRTVADHAPNASPHREARRLRVDGRRRWNGAVPADGWRGEAGDRRHVLHRTRRHRARLDTAGNRDVRGRANRAARSGRRERRRDQHDRDDQPRVATVEQRPTPVLGTWWYPDTNRTLYYRNGLEQLSRVQADLPGRPASPNRLATPQPVGTRIASCTHCETADTGRRWSIRDDASHTAPLLTLSWIESASAAFRLGNADPELSMIARWSPDGSALVFASLKDNQIYLVRARARDAIKLTTRARNADPVLSPDGRYVYFSSDRSGRWQLWRANLDGSAPEQLTHDDFDDMHPYVSPDGRSVAFLAFDAATTNRGVLRDARLRVLTLADGRIVELAKLLGGDSSLAGYPWSPDAQYLAFVSYQHASR
ncbi:MAG: hypothetical protein DMD35_22320 [Gemmatimonadetes bacterium]|nr:MAG: hypothetical protein DMD35_22320 [Gemmatimonadota bacterium]